jgi:hypothetical protein
MVGDDIALVPGILNLLSYRQGEDLDRENPAKKQNE